MQKLFHLLLGCLTFESFWYFANLINYNLAVDFESLHELFQNVTLSTTIQHEQVAAGKLQVGRRACLPVWGCVSDLVWRQYLLSSTHPKKVPIPSCCVLLVPGGFDVQTPCFLPWVKRTTRASTRPGVCCTRHVSCSVPTSVDNLTDDILDDAFSLFSKCTSNTYSFILNLLLYLLIYIDS